MTSSLGVRLKAARTAKGYGLREVAKRSGVSASSISRAERGHERISAEYLTKLAECYGVSLYDLVHIETDLGDDGKTMLQGYLVAIAQARAEVKNVLDSLERLATAILSERKAP